MKKQIEKAIWLTYDLGIGGDYPNLYKCLDDHEAIECGDSVAFFKYSIDQSEEANIIQVITKDLKETVTLRSGDRMYIIRRQKTDKGYSIKGEFIFGKRKARPWEGYGDKHVSASESGE